MTRFGGWLLVLGVLALGSSASAGQVVIQYDITSGILDATGAYATPVGLGGAFSVRLTANSVNSIASGPATLVSLVVTTGQGFGFPTGTFRSGLVGAPGTFPKTIYTYRSGQFRTAGAFVQTGNVNVGGTVSVGYPPGTYFPTLFIPVVTGTGSGGIAQGWASGSLGQLTVKSTVANTTLVPGLSVLIPSVDVFTGQEVSRTFVPEPAASRLVAVGLLGLLGLAGAARVRGNARSRRRGQG